MAAILIRHKNVWNQPIRQSNASNRKHRHLGTRAVFEISMPPLPKDIPKLEIRERVATGRQSGGTSGAKVEWMAHVPLVRLVCMSNY